jgi:hypothetical protein
VQVETPVPPVLGKEKVSIAATLVETNRPSRNADLGIRVFNAFAPGDTI